MNSSSKGGSGFDPELAAKIEALEKQQTVQRRCPHCGALSKTQRLTCESCGNYFERGAEQTIWDAKVGQVVKAGVPTDEDEQLAALKSYLAKRIIAKVLDTVIIGSIVILQYMTYFALARYFTSVPQLAPLMLTVFYWFMPVLTLASLLGYQAAFESSPVQATPGKLIMNLYVVNMEGKQVRSEPVVFKAFLSYLPFFGFASVWLYFLVTKCRYGMHLDAISTAVLAISGVAFFVTFLAMHIILGSEKKHQTIPDLLTGIVVQER